MSRTIVNVVFDLGGVLLTWDPQGIAATVFEAVAQRDLVLADVFGHADWHALDRGTLTHEDAAQRAHLRTGLPLRDLERLLREVSPSLRPIEASVALLERLSRTGHRLLYLSNMHRVAAADIRARHSFWRLFEGGVFSCEVGLVKPEPAIYAHLLTQYALDPRATVLVDDMPANLEVAATLGLATVRFENAQQCEWALRQLGVGAAPIP